jgi:hypothetical protein
METTMEHFIGDVLAGQPSPKEPAYEYQPMRLLDHAQRMETYAGLIRRKLERSSISLPESMMALCNDLRRCTEARFETANLVEMAHTACDVRRAQIVLDEGVVNGKNEAQRNAQLLLALTCDADYQCALTTESQLKRALAAAEAKLDACRAKLSLLRAYLLSQAIQD